MKLLNLFFLIFISQILYSQSIKRPKVKYDSVPPLVIVPTEFSGTCKEAKALISDEKKCAKLHPLVYNAALMKLSECQILSYAEECLGEKPYGLKEEYKQEAVLIYDFQDDKEYYGFIKGKDLKKLKKWTKDAAIGFGIEVSKSEPITGGIIVLASEISINSFYNAALKEDPTLFLQPMALSGIESIKTSVKLINNEWGAEIERLHNEFIDSFKDDIKDAGEIVKRNPLWVVNPGWAATVETFEKTVGAVESVTIAVIKNPEKNIDILIAPTIVAPVEIVKKIFHW